jgi:hypothetical protein
MMDNVVVIKEKDFGLVEAFACLFATYWVFGVQYPKKIRNSMHFLEHFIYKLSEKKPQQKVMKVFDMLCRSS